MLKNIHKYRIKFSNKTKRRRKIVANKKCQAVSSDMWYLLFLLVYYKLNIGHDTFYLTNEIIVNNNSSPNTC